MKRVLVIEDNKEIRENTAELLTLNGYEVFTAVNGKIGFKELKSKRPDIVLCDIMMPETDGKEFLKLAKSDESTKATPVILFSAGSVSAKVGKGLMTHANDYLHKPFTEQELLSAIENALNQNPKRH